MLRDALDMSTVSLFFLHTSHTSKIGIVIHHLGIGFVNESLLLIGEFTPAEHRDIMCLLGRA